MTLRVLCLDIEGGFGGSSRSLFESLRNMPDGIDATVWCRRQGPILDRYRALGIPCQVTPDMPHYSTLPRLSRNVYALVRFLPKWLRSRKFRRALAKACETEFDVVHLNHEGLFLTAQWLRRALGRRVRLSAHVRTLLPSTVFSRWQYRILLRSVNELAFITENEQANVACLTGRPKSGRVIYNIVPILAPTIPSDTEREASKFTVVSVSNYAWIRGTDRMVDIAVALRDKGRPDITFVVAGDIDLNGRLPGLLGKIARKGGTLADYAAARGVGDMFSFLGHVADPAPVLLKGDVLVRPSRGKDPWAREVLEAMAAGLPVISIGTYARFVESDITGQLLDTFDPVTMAEAIIDLADNRDRCGRLGDAAVARVEELCDGAARARDLADIWQKVAQ